MKRFIVSLVVVAGALLSACTESTETIQSVGLSGTYDLALVGDLLFVTSADNDELRVLQMSTDVKLRQFVKAPNPIEPLSIPVLDRPQALARDERYDAEGNELAGSYVYARSSGSTLVSVVAAAPSYLRELTRLDTRTLTQTNAEADRSAGPVTAFAARAAELAEGAPEENRGSTLYYATQEDTGARLWQVQLPGPAQFNAEVQQALKAEPLGVALPANVAVTSILVLPQSGMLAVSTRTPAGSTTQGTSFTVNVGTLARQELKFGAQVLQLATHGKVSFTNRLGASQTLGAGERIFAVLDASSCGGAPQCTGVLAVDAGTGEVLPDATGYRMLAIGAGSGLPMGLSLTTSTKLIVQLSEPMDYANPSDPSNPDARTQRDTVVPLLGISPLSNGELLFFDAVNLVPFNVNANNVTGEDGITRTENKVTVTQSLIRATGTAAEATGDIEVGTTYGVTRSQTYVLTYESVLPGMEGLAIEDGAFKVPFMPRGTAKGQVAQPGDRVVLLQSASGTQSCVDGELTVTAVLPPSGGETRATLVTSGAIPATCAGFGYFQVRASGNQPLVLATTGDDYLQRLGVNDTYSTTGTYFFHPEGYMGQTENTSVSIRVTSLARGTLVRGARYVVATQANYFPYVITVDTVNFAGLRSFRLPGPVVYWKPPEGTGYAYIVYPSANGVLEVDLTNIDASVANGRGLVPYQ